MAPVTPHKGQQVLRCFPLQLASKGCLPAQEAGGVRSWVQGFGSFRSAKLRSWHGRLPMSTSCLAVGCDSVSESAGTMLSTRHLGRTSIHAEPGRRSRSSCFVACSPNPSSTSRGALTGLIERHSCPTRKLDSAIWLGGSGEKALDRAARLADGFIFFGGGIETTEVWTSLRKRVARAGRSVDEFGGDYVALSGGDVGELTREIEAWRNAGGTHVSVVTMGLGLNSVEV